MDLLILDHRGTVYHEDPTFSRIVSEFYCSALRTYNFAWKHRHDSILSDMFSGVYFQIMVIMVDVLDLQSCSAAWSCMGKDGMKHNTR